MKIRNPKSEARKGFTLIELLVVITIIVILLAMLVPAMEKAIYQAQLVVCATQQKAIAGGALNYAAENKRYYFNRTVLAPGSGVCEPLMLANENGADDRLLIRPYIPFKLFSDPFADKIPMEVGEAPASGRVHASYELWFGVRFGDYGGYSNTGMKKIGDRFSFFDDADFTGARYRFNSFKVLASDLDFSGFDRSIIFNGHPDSDGNLAPDTHRTPANSDNYSRWVTGASVRGKTDSNYAYDDGSVLRLNGLSLDYDERLAAVPYQVNNQNWSYYAVHIPKQ